MSPNKYSKKDITTKVVQLTAHSSRRRDLYECFMFYIVCFLNEILFSVGKFVNITFLYYQNPGFSPLTLSNFY